MKEADGEEVGDDDGEDDAEADDPEAVGEPDADREPDETPDGDPVGEAEVPLPGPDADAPGEKIAGCAEEGELVQALTALPRHTVNATAPTAVYAFLRFSLVTVRPSPTCSRNGVLSICLLGYWCWTCCGRRQEEWHLAKSRWRRVGGLSVVMSWPEDGFSSPPPPLPRGTTRARFFGFSGVMLVVSGALAVTVAVVSQQHAPQPSAAAAGATSAHRGPSLKRSTPVTLNIPAISVHSNLLRLGLNTDGTIEVPALPSQANRAAWYTHSVTPGQIGSAVIEGHVDSYAGPAVFFRLGALRPGNVIDVTRADGVTAIFKVTGVREYPKTEFPAPKIYGRTDYAALRLITCGGTFDSATGHYLSSTVVFASLSGYRPAGTARRSIAESAG